MKEVEPRSGDGTLPGRVFLAGSLLAGLLYMVVFPPLSIADETLHFYRAIGLASGEVVAPRVDGRASATVPSSTLRLVGELRTGHALPIEPERRIAVEDLRASYRWPLERSRRELVDLVGIGMFPFVAHLAPALGIAVGLALDASPPLLVLCGRVTNLLLASLVVWWAIRLAPVGRWGLVVAALTPMAVSSRASLSADAATTALAFLFLALVARWAWGEGMDRRERRLVAGAAVALCLTKLPYVVLLAAVALVPRERLEMGRRRVGWAVAAAAVALAIVFAVWAAWRVDPATRPGTDTDRNRATLDLVVDPGRVARAVAADFAVHADRYAVQAIGIQLGWLDVQLPAAPVVAYGLGFLALVLLGEPGARIARWQRLLLAAVGAVLAVGISVSQYAIWTPSAAAAVEGVQGRYFLPAAPLVVWLLLRHRRRPLPQRPVAAAVLAGHVAITALTCWYVVQRYYG